MDLNRFKQVVARAKEARTDGDLPSAATLLSEALGMWNRSVGLSARTKIYCESVRSVRGREGSRPAGVARTVISRARSDPGGG
ncbi:BTAD domain-containing putative transcriptional regulator [Streptomyces mirabilis]|uniref:BTAD domain-containing putative transcriptional regulator n=1 Tax=Streptomyces mirabilis TaxID=68239 RepID=UPI0036C739BE